MHVQREHRAGFSRHLPGCEQEMPGNSQGSAWQGRVLVLRAGVQRPPPLLRHTGPRTRGTGLPREQQEGKCRRHGKGQLCACPVLWWDAGTASSARDEGRAGQRAPSLGLVGRDACVHAYQRCAEGSTYMRVAVLKCESCACACTLVLCVPV